jgi:hypothetical protein
MRHPYMTHSRSWFRLTLFISLLATFSVAADPGYHVIKTYKLGGEGGWDYLKLDSSSS